MAVSETQLYQPSRALLPFAVFFLLVSIYLVFQLLALASFLVVLLLIPFIAFVFWWFGALILHVAKFSVELSRQGIKINKPSGVLSGVDNYFISWDEIEKVSFSYEKNINPQHFSGRNTTLTLTLRDGTVLPIDQITILENYSALFERIQARTSFTYTLPKEHLWDTKTKIGILLILVILCVGLLYLFLR